MVSQPALGQKSLDVTCPVFQYIQYILYQNTAPGFEYPAMAYLNTLPYLNTVAVFEYVPMLYLNALLVYKGTV